MVSEGASPSAAALTPLPRITRLLGALLAGALSRFPSRHTCIIASIATVLTTGALAQPLNEPAIIVLRGLAGIASALAMVAASHWLIHDRQHATGAPALFSGVGIGIMLPAELVAGGR